MLDFPITDRDRERLVHELDLLAQFDQPTAPGRTPVRTSWLRRAFTHHAGHSRFAGAH